MEKSLERAAYQAIKREAERFQVIDSAKSEGVFFKRYEQWEKASAAVGTHIAVYETYHWLVSELREGLEFVTGSGCLQSPEGMEAVIGVVADLIQEIPHTSTQAVADRLHRQKGELVKYLEPLKEKFAELMAQVGDAELIRRCLLEWRLEKDATQKGKQKIVETCPARSG